MKNNFRSVYSGVSPSFRLHPLGWLLSVFFKRPISVLLTAVILAVVIIFWNFAQLTNNILESNAVKHAALYTQALAQFRILYTSEVVARVEGHGIEVTHDYQAKEGAIPLPATLSIILGKHIGKVSEGSTIKLFSKHPFPWRKNGGIIDAFEREALASLQENPQQPYYRFEEYNGRWALRYATADQMHKSCVDCHNKHPDSPKKDWQVGDVRGVLEIIQPLDEAAMEIRRSLFGTIVLISIVCLLGLGLAFLFIREMKYLSNVDGLTGVSNRRFFDGYLEAEWQRAIRQGSIVSVIMIDVDHFKEFNDVYGHPEGDACLQRIAQAIQESVRISDLVARYGGEEFSLVVPETNVEGVKQLADKICARIESLAMPHSGSDVKDVVTISIGFSAVYPDDWPSPEVLIKQADQALYHAKRSGRNRVVSGIIDKKILSEMGIV